jgi:hypothetical protein
MTVDNEEIALHPLNPLNFFNTTSSFSIFKYRGVLASNPSRLVKISWQSKAPRCPLHHAKPTRQQQDANKKEKRVGCAGDIATSSEL